MTLFWGKLVLGLQLGPVLFGDVPSKNRPKKGDF